VGVVPDVVVLARVRVAARAIPADLVQRRGHAATQRERDVTRWSHSSRQNPAPSGHAGA
jgi:hypothetical protein